MDIYVYTNGHKIYFHGSRKDELLPLLHISYMCNILILSATLAVALILQQ